MSDNLERALNVTGSYGTLALPTLALYSLTSKEGMGVYASADTLYKGAVFGRDSLEVADDIMGIKPRLVQNILLTLASLQGVRFDNDSEEEPGKIIHEYRNVVVDGKFIDKSSLSIFNKLASKWGGSETELAYYGSVDATPQFLSVLGKYVSMRGSSILSRTVTHRDGSLSPVIGVTKNAAAWVIKNIESSKSGMVEYKKVNPHGISNQVWKDSEEFYVHENGERVNHNAGVASIEVQALAYDGLHAAAKLLHNPIYAKYAERLRDTTISSLWLEERGNFALGIDYDKDNNPRVIKTLAANQAALLDSTFFDNLAPHEKQKYVSGIITTIMSPEFLTDAGIRSRALSGAHLVDKWDYHGSFVSWAKETYDAAKGMRRQGFPNVARQLENRILNVCLRYKSYLEFVYVDKTGRVLASAPSSSTHGEFTFIQATNTPEKVQAWTVSAVLAIISRRIKDRIPGGRKQSQTPWQQELEADILAGIPNINRHFTPAALQARYPDYRYKLQ